MRGTKNGRMIVVMMPHLSQYRLEISAFSRSSVIWRAMKVAHGLDSDKRGLKIVLLAVKCLQRRLGPSSDGTKFICAGCHDCRPARDGICALNACILLHSRSTPVNSSSTFQIVFKPRSANMKTSPAPLLLQLNTRCTCRK